MKLNHPRCPLHLGGKKDLNNCFSNDVRPPQTTRILYTRVMPIPAKTIVNRGGKDVIASKITAVPPIKTSARAPGKIHFR